MQDGHLLRLLSPVRVALPLSLFLAVASGAWAGIDPCDGDLVFPNDCVDQLGAIGEPPMASPVEGFRNIVSPIIDPLLLLASSNEANGRLFVLNPLANLVRVLDPGNGLAVVADIPVCYRPSALAQSADGSAVLVACHASNAVGIIDPVANRMVGEIQDRDADGRPLLQEPMGMVVVGDTAYVASSQNHRVAVVDLPSRQVQSYIDVPGEDPRSLTVTDDGQFLIVANLLAGNRTEADVALNAHIFDPNGGAGSICAPLMEGSGGDVMDETHPSFMDTSHPDYEILAECYIFAHTFGVSSEVSLNPLRPDHDLAVIRLSDAQVVFTTDALATDVGTLNYGVRYAGANGRVYLATAHARNFVDFGNRPMLNRLAILDLDSQTGALSISSINDLDAPFLDTEGLGDAIAATPYAVAVAGPRVLIAAAGSDRLVITDLDGTITGSIPVGFTPKGVVASGNSAYVYNATGQTLSRIDLAAGQVVATASIGPNPMPQILRIGAHLFNSAEFAVNKTFSCASCHPDGHLDGLVWELNEIDGMRTTMTVQEISETDPYHWDGAKCNQAQILIDGITGLFQNPAGPSDCQMKTLIDFMDSMVRPHSPFRAVDDRLTDEAKLGVTLIQRGRFKNLQDEERTCSTREQDPAVEPKYLAAVGDPYQQSLIFNDAGGPVQGTSTTETCSVVGCHVTPHWSSPSGVFEAVSVHGMWDRPITMHHGRPMRAKFLEALDVNRVYHGVSLMDPEGHFTGKAAAHSFNDGHFRHPELNFDGNPASNAFILTDAMTQFIVEEEQLQTGCVGLTLVLDAANKNGAAENARLALLESAADQGKCSYVGVGLLGGAPHGSTWDVANQSFAVDGGGTLTLQQLKDALVPGDAVMLYGALLPGQGALPDPKLRAVYRSTSPVLCSEGYTEYHANVQTGETDVPLVLRGIDVVAGSRVLIDGQVTGQPLGGAIGSDFPWSLPLTPATPTILAVQVLSPSGMQSNAVSLPVVPPVAPAFEPNDVVGFKIGPAPRLRWQDQFGLTGPGTRYDVYRGELEDLATSGLTSGRCVGSALVKPLSADPEAPDPGEGFYYVVRAQNQVNVTTWGSPQRDAEAAASILPCQPMFP